MLTFHNDEKMLTNAYLERRHAASAENRLPYFGAWYMFRENLKERYRALASKMNNHVLLSIYGILKDIGFNITF